jgi:hypothetical protein
MDFDAMTIWVIQKHLVPARNGPAAVIFVTNAQGIALAHKALNVVCSEAEVTVTHGVHKLLHLETSFQIALGPMKLDVAIGQKVDFACVSTVFTLTADDVVLCICDGAQLKQGLIKLGQSWQVVGTNVHVVKLEFHSAFFQLGGFFTSKGDIKILFTSVFLELFFQLCADDKPIYI